MAKIDAVLEGLLAATLLVSTTGIALTLGLACGGETAPASSSSAPASTCHDEAHREQDVNLVVCAEHARIELVDGWILCRCTPAPSTGGTQ